MDHGEGEALEKSSLKCLNCGQITHKLFQCKNLDINNGGKNRNSSGGNFCQYCRKSGCDKKNCLKLKKKEVRNNNHSNYSGNNNPQNYESQDVVFTAASKNGTLSSDIWICDSGAFGHYCKLIEGIFDVKYIEEKITVGNGNNMMAKKLEVLSVASYNLTGQLCISLSMKLSMFLIYVLICSASTKL